ncbi:MAG: TonB-dependent receptor [Prevotella sp.]|nr:TonB-dependent receptor [Prevotella sp.]
MNVLKTAKLWKSLMLLMALVLSMPAFAGPVKVSGRVQDVEGEPLIGVTIQEKGTTNAVITDLNGQYNITVSSEKAVLVVSYVGFKPEEKKVNGTLIDFILHEDVSKLDEVVVTGYTTSKKVSVLGAQSSLKMEHVKAPVANMSSVLAGRVSGVVSVQRTGVPGQDDSDIWIRGISTLTNRNEGPLVLVDGIERSFNNLDPEDIESITVLKDAASTAVYGVRGGNGVIIITTKPGEVSKPKFSFDIYQGITSLTRVPDLVDGIEYMDAVNEAYRTSRGSNYYGDIQILNTKLANNMTLTPEDMETAQGLYGDGAGNLVLPASVNKYLYPNVDWMKELYHKTGWNRRANVNIRGGAPNASYYISLSYYTEKGLTKRDKAQDYSSEIDYDRYNFLTNVNLKASKTTNIDVGVSGWLSSGNYPHIGLGEIFTKAMSTNPVLYPVQYANGLNPGSTPENRELDSPWVTLTRRGYQTQHQTQINTNLKLTQDLGFWKWSKGLTARALIAFDVRATQSLHYAVDDSTWKPTGGQRQGVWVEDTRLYPQATDAEGNLVWQQAVDAEGNLMWDTDAEGNQVPVYAVDASGNKIPVLDTDPTKILLSEQYKGNSSMSVSSDKWVYRTFYFEAALDYKRIFAKDHTVTGLVLFNLRNYLDANGASLFTTLPYKQQSLSARLTYDYKNRYFVETNLGYTGSENFEPGHRFGFFPAWAIGWVPSNEPWWKPVSKVISFLKFRYSDGTVGNDSSGERFSYFTKIGSGSSRNTYWGNSGLAYENYGYKPQWSKVRKQDLGIEINFLNDDLTFVFDFFKERRSKIFVERANVPLIAGFARSISANVGIVENKGYEAAFEYSHQFGKDWFVSFRANMTENKDKVIENAQADPAYPWLDRRGHNVLAEWGYVAEGLYTSVEQIQERGISQFGETYPGELVAPGDIMYKDMNGDNHIDEYDQVCISRGDVPRIYYGFGGDIRYKNIGLGILFQGVADAERILRGNGIRPFTSTSGGGTLYSNISDRWSEDNPTKTDVFYPRLAWGQNDPHNINNFQTSTWWKRDVSFMRLKQFTVSYYFPKRWQQSGFLRGGRFYVMGENVFTFSKFKLWDPELNTDNGISYPNVRTFSVGVNFNI